MTRLGVSASIAIGSGIATLFVLATIRVVDWILGGSLYGWAFLLFVVVAVFVAVFLLDALTDGKLR